MIKPTIGRVVWFWASTEHSKDGEAEVALPFAALVTFVHDDYTVNLAVFDKQGDCKPQPVVNLWQGDGERPHGPYCEWMPYQKGQAAKTDIPQEIFAKVETLLTKVAALEALVAGARAAAAAHVPLPATNAPVPPPLTKTSNSTSENPAKDGTGVA